MQTDFIRDVGFVLVIPIAIWVTLWSLKKDRNYWAQAARVMGLSRAPRGPRQKIADNLKWFIPYMDHLRDKRVSTIALSELEGIQHNHQTSLAMYEIHQRILGSRNGKTYFCVQRFKLETHPTQTSIVSKVESFMEVTLTSPAHLGVLHSTPDFTVASTGAAVWDKIRPVWQASYEFCHKQRLGLLIEDGYLFMYSPFRPIDLQQWSAFSRELLAVIDHDENETRERLL